MAAKISIELVFALPDRQVLIQMQVDQGVTARSVILQSPLPAQFPTVDFAGCEIGVWGKPVEDGYRLQAGDRLEAYRPLLHDPRIYRRELAAHGKSMGTASTPAGEKKERERGPARRR